MQIAILVLCAVAVAFLCYIGLGLSVLYDDIRKLYDLLDKVDTEIFDMKYEVKLKQLHKEEIEEKDNA